MCGGTGQKPGPVPLLSKMTIVRRTRRGEGGVRDPSGPIIDRQTHPVGRNYRHNDTGSRSRWSVSCRCEVDACSRQASAWSRQRSMSWRAWVSNSLMSPNRCSDLHGEAPSLPRGNYETPPLIRRPRANNRRSSYWRCAGTDPFFGFSIARHTRYGVHGMSIWRMP